MEASWSAGCEEVLNSDFSWVGPVPLALVGACAYSLAGALAWAGRKAEQKGEEGAAEGCVQGLVMAGGTMAGLSAFLVFGLGGRECPYCVASAGLSLSIFLSGAAMVEPRETAKGVGAMAVSAAVATLSISGRGEAVDVPYEEPRVETRADSRSVALAQHLRRVGARMYGAFWCGHCEEQLAEFGKGAPVPYVECFPSGVGKEGGLAEECQRAEVRGFPTWVINGETHEGKLSLDELARLSQFQGSN